MVRSQEIGFIEEFAIAADREKSLGMLIPGTEDYFFYHTLHCQNVGRLGESKGYMDSWLSKFGQTEKFREMHVRQMLLTYSEAPQSTLEYLQTEFGLNLDHSAPQRDEAASLSTKLDPRTIDWASRFREALTSGGRLAQIEDVALQEALTLIEYQPDYRSWIERVLRPDLPGLVDAIVKELQLPDSRGFGWANIHRNLTLEQLVQIKKKIPKLIESDSFVQTYLLRLRPSDDATLTDATTRREYYSRLEAFTEELPESQNSLKASVLYHRLKMDLAEHLIDRPRFLKYLALPRQMGYVNAETTRQQASRPSINYSQDFSATTTLLPIGDDSELIRNYLEHFFQSDKDVDAFAKFLDRDYLKIAFATTKILYGLGEPKTYYAQLSPEQQKELQERVELRFLPTNKVQFSPSDRVQLAVSIKNVPQLIIKIYRLNPKNILQAQSQSVSTAIDLDGLVANIERTVDFSQARDRRHSESIDLPELDGRGVWVVDLLGGGQRSRALVQKGQLRSLRTISDAGHLLRIVDESGKPVPNARVMLGEREFAPAKDGAVLVPYASTTANRSIVLVDGNFASLEQLTHFAETYQLEAGFLVEPQSVRPGAKTAVVIRSQLTCNGVRIPISLLEKAKLTITATDQDGIQTSQVFNSLELSDTLEASQAFLVPQRLVSLTFSLSGLVHNLSLAIRQPISASQNLAVNGMVTTAQIGDVYLARHAAGFRLEARGRNGESLSRLPVQFMIKLQGIRNPIHVRLATDNDGFVDLGELSKVERIWVSTDGIQQREFAIDETWIDWPSKLNLSENQNVELAWPESDDLAKKDMQRFSLIEYRGGQVSTVWSQALKVLKGKLIAEKLPVGGYRLTDHRTGATVEIDIVSTIKDGEYLIGKNKALQASHQNGSYVAKTLIQNGELKIQLDGYDASTRVHLLATTFDRSLSEIRAMRVSLATLQRLDSPPLPSFYLDSMRLDEEYQYVLQRQLAKKYPGSLLPQPSVLLNPWELSITNNESQIAKGGDAFADMAANAPRPSMMRQANEKMQNTQSAGSSSTYDFLTRGSLVVSNLRPDEKGEVSIEVSALEGLTNFIAVVVHPDGTTYRRVALPLDKPRRLIDNRLAKAFDQERKLAERQRVRVLVGGEKSDLGEAISTRAKLYGSLAEVYSLYSTYLNHNVDFAKFQVIQTWPSLSDADKLIQYGTLECHELNLFLYFHDRAFFDRVVKPYLANKLEKQFMDDWLLEKDLSKFEQPWRLARMNAAERALLARRISSQLEPTSRWFRDTLAARPETSNPELLAQRFGTALLGDALDASRTVELFALRSAMAAPAEAEMQELAKSEMNFNAGGMAGGVLELRDESAAKKLGIKRKEALARDKDGDMRARRSLGEDRSVQLYRALEATRKWAETQYYHVPLQNQTAELARVNPFWRDFVGEKTEGVEGKLAGAGARVSESFDYLKHLDSPVSSLSEALMALAVMPLPIEAKPVELAVEDGRLVAKHATTSVAFIESIEAVEPATNPASILVGQDIYLVSPSDASQAKPVQDKSILINVAYRATVVLTNPASSPQRVQLLTQIPQGAIPLSGGKMIRGTTMELGPYSSQQISYDFYFPASGSYAHYGAQVSNESGHLASAVSTSLTVLEKPESVDETTWAYVAAWGTNDQVLAFLKKANLQQLDISAIAWRMHDRPFFDTTLELLTQSGRFDSTLWSYAVKHNDARRLTEWVEIFAPITSLVGPVFKSRLLNVEPVERFSYQHLDFRPMVVARIHQLGNQRLILNDGLAQQYRAFMNFLAYQSKLDDAQRLSIVYYLLIQNRIEEAMTQFDAIDVTSIDQKLQYDYFASVFDLYRGEYDAASKRALNYADYPQPRWRDWFAQILSQVSTWQRMERGEPIDNFAIEEWQTDEQQRMLSGARESDQMNAAEKLPALDLVDESGTIKVNYRNVEQLVVNYYLMDIELLFSRKPFVQNEGARLSSIEPNLSETVALDRGTTTRTLSIPESLKNRNMVLEVVGNGITRSHVIYANSLTVALSTKMGRLQTSTSKDRKPLDTAYVKVYARHQDGSVRFYKDGYTDLRGQFDYASLSTNDMETTQRFSILVMHPEHGAIIREAEPPKK